MLSLLLLALWVCPAIGDYTVTIYPEFLKLGHTSQFTPSKWNGMNGIDSGAKIPSIQQAGAVSARWIHGDFSKGIFEKAIEDPQRKGYPDPNYFLSLAPNISDKFLQNMNGFHNPDIVMEIKGLNWPQWVDTSLHHGRFPNNIVVAAEFELQLLEAVDKYTKGILPTYFEVVNEPGGKFKDTNWTTYTEFHKVAAEKLKSKFPHMQVGGPTLSGASRAFDRTDFKIWKKLESFMDTAMSNLDFFSFHSYTRMDVRGGSHVFHGNSEARIFGLLDLIESHSHKIYKKSTPVIISEYGLGPTDGIDLNKPSDFVYWSVIYQHNVQMFAFLERRDILKKVVAYLVGHSEAFGQISINHSILDRHNHLSLVAQAFLFWKPFTTDMSHLRVDSEFHGTERQVIPHALVDPSKGSMYVLLHNHDQKPSHVTLNFHQQWFHPLAANSTCEYLNAKQKPVLETKTIRITNSMVTLPPEASCHYHFQVGHDFSKAGSISQVTFYSKDTVIPIHQAVNTKVMVPHLGNLKFARLRVGVSLSDFSADSEPRTLFLNQHPLTSFYSVQTENLHSDDTVFQSYVYDVPINILRDHNNDVHITFMQTGGYVSTVAIILGRQM